MKGRLFSIVMTMLVLCEQVSAESLPSWSNEDRARLSRGELIVGADILVEDPPKIPPKAQIVEEDVLLIEPPEPEPVFDPELIADEFLPVYFLSYPEDYLVDPQRLLSMQEALDRKVFLEYHADDSELDMRMYLFDENQKIPDPYTIEWLCRERYADGPLTAVVFCYLGDPRRSQLAFGGEGAAEVSPRQVRRMLESTKIKAMEKSDPAAQLEAFIVQLSIRLYWLEKERGESRAVAAANEDDAANGLSLYFEAHSGGDSMILRGDEPIAMIKAYSGYMVAGLLGLLSLSGGIWLGWSLWSRTRIYHFPVFDPPERLGAKYAAGVGAVLAFHSELGSPSNQRSQSSNYLTRI